MKIFDLPITEFETGGKINKLATRAGYSSGKAFINDENLWDEDVDSVIKILKEDIRKQKKDLKEK